MKKIQCYIELHQIDEAAPCRLQPLHVVNASVSSVNHIHRFERNIYDPDYGMLVSTNPSETIVPFGEARLTK